MISPNLQLDRPPSFRVAGMQATDHRCMCDGGTRGIRQALLQAALNVCKMPARQEARCRFPHDQEGGSAIPVTPLRRQPRDDDECPSSIEVEVTIYEIRSSSSKESNQFGRRQESRSRGAKSPIDQVT
jgi:hypothetical protein